MSGKKLCNWLWLQCPVRRATLVAEKTRGIRLRAEMADRFYAMLKEIHSLADGIYAVTGRNRDVDTKDPA